MYLQSAKWLFNQCNPYLMCQCRWHSPWRFTISLGNTLDKYLYQFNIFCNAQQGSSWSTRQLWNLTLLLQGNPKPHESRVSDTDTTSVHKNKLKQSLTFPITAFLVSRCRTSSNVSPLVIPSASSSWSPFSPSSSPSSFLSLATKGSIPLWTKFVHPWTSK